MAVIPLLGVSRNDVLWMDYGRILAKGQFFFIFISMVCLGYAFATDDFTVEYVANNSNSRLPMQYKLSAIWGGHEGSMLLWVFILSGWTMAVSIFSRNLPLDILARVLAVMGMIAIGFMLFTLLTSSPFSRLLPNHPIDGNDLNPLLQDIGLIVHPPMLYMGYVGFSVAFAFAIAALLSGRLDAAWARWSRPWTVIAWAFLGLGIT
ncbi:MAG: cytochrome c biogenesis protein CcsA, partial [Methylococcales bacterium]